MWGRGASSGTGFKRRNQETRIQMEWIIKKMGKRVNISHYV